MPSAWSTELISREQWRSARKLSDDHWENLHPCVNSRSSTQHAGFFRTPPTLCSQSSSGSQDACYAIYAAGHRGEWPLSWGPFSSLIHFNTHLPPHAVALHSVLLSPHTPIHGQTNKPATSQTVIYCHMGPWLSLHFFLILSAFSLFYLYSCGSVNNFLCVF